MICFDYNILRFIKPRGQIYYNLRNLTTKMQDVIETTPVDCEGVDYQEIEQLGTTIAGHVQDLVMNVDISNAQYDT